MFVFLYNFVRVFTPLRFEVYIWTAIEKIGLILGYWISRRASFLIENKAERRPVLSCFSTEIGHGFVL